MAKKKRRKLLSYQILDDLREETVGGIWAISLFALAALLILSALDMAGMVGGYIYRGLTFLLGVGYYLFPMLMLLLAASFIGSISREFGKARMIGSFVFFISGLGLIALLFDGSGGLVGSYISAPLISLFDFWASILLLSALAIIALIMILDMYPSLAFIKSLLSLIRLRKKRGLDEADEEALYGTMEDEYMEDETETEDDAVETEKKAPLGNIFNRSKKPDDDFVDDDVERTATSYEKYTPPPLSLLEQDRGKPGHGDVKANANSIKRTLQNFGIQVEMDEVSIGPSVTRYALKPAEGVRLSKIVSLQNNLELALAAHPVRIEAPIPGKALVGIEVPNTTKATLGLGTLLAGDVFQNSTQPLLMSLGKDITGTVQFSNLAKMPHLLIAGTTGSGKSVTIHGLISSLLYRNGPQQLRFIMIDPKRVELTLYNGIPHLYAPVITDAKKAILSLKWAAKEMERRYDILEAEKVRDVHSYHLNIVGPAMEEFERNKDDSASSEDLPEPMPYIVIVIDELADIMQTYPRELEAAIVRLAQMSRAVGIHLILSTQRPSVNVITGLIKANVPARVALQVASQIDSRTILDSSGAEKLLGAGDLLYLSGEMSKPQRIQAPYISEKEVKKVVSYLKKEYEDELMDEIEFTNQNSSTVLFDSSIEVNDEEDDLYEEAREIVIEAGKASTSYLQRKLRVGYSRAARLMDMLEERGVIGAADGSKAREVLEGGPDKEDSYEEEEEL